MQKLNQKLELIVKIPIVNTISFVGGVVIGTLGGLLGGDNQYTTLEKLLAAGSVTAISDVGYYLRYKRKSIDVEHIKRALCFSPGLFAGIYMGLGISNYLKNNF